MRRSVREATVGFSILAAAASAFGLSLWLRGISLNRNTWSMEARFADAAGLAVRSPVSYRGVLVGSVSRIEVNDQDVVARLEITDPKLHLARPVLARVVNSSVLGGNAEVDLLSSGKALPAGTPPPQEKGCDNSLIVCNQGKVPGVAMPSLDDVTSTMQRLLDQADRQQLVQKLSAATLRFDKAADATTKLTDDGRLFMQDARQLVKRLDGSVAKANPMIANLNGASLDVAKASKHVRNITSALDNPKTVSELKQTVSHARQLAERWDAVGGDVNKLTADPRFMDGMRSVATGLGKFFDELYPAQRRDSPPAANPSP
jgi:phospholipid/cholesterol/gamma-HCH transport system substrate-binding protein